MAPDWDVADVVTNVTDLLGGAIFFGLIALGLGIKYGGRVIGLVKRAGK